MITEIHDNKDLSYEYNKVTPVLATQDLMAMEKRVKISMNVRMITLTIVTPMPVALISMVRSPVPVTTVM